MDPQGWSIAVGAVVLGLLQVLSLLKAWHLEIRATRTEVKQEEGRKELVKDVANVHQLVNSQMTALQKELTESRKEVAELKATLAQMIERDATKADIARGEEKK